MPLNPNSYTAVFISEEVLKENSVINANVDMEMLRPIMKLATDIYLQELIGSSLYVDLQNKIASFSTNANEKFLLKAYIHPFLIWSIMKEVPVYTTYRHSNKGIQVANSDNSQPAAMDDLNKLSDKADIRAGFYGTRLIQYLNDNKTLFPSYKGNTNDEVRPSRNAYTSRLRMVGAKRKHC